MCLIYKGGMKMKKKIKNNIPYHFNLHFDHHAYWNFIGREHHHHCWFRQ
jgi:hypothetical protein